MSARVYVVDNTFGDSLSFTGALSIDQAVRSAERNIADLPRPSIRGVERLVKGIEWEGDADGPLPAHAIRRLYKLSSDLIDVGKAWGLDALSAAAVRLCDRLEQAEATGELDHAALRACIWDIQDARAREAPAAAVADSERPESPLAPRGPSSGPAERVMTDTRLRVLHVSERWRRVQGRAAAEVLGACVLDLPDGGGERWREVYQRALTGHPQVGEADRWLIGGGLPTRWEVAPWRAAGVVSGLLLTGYPVAPG